MNNAGNSRRPWILDADLKSAFDKISHEHILKAIGQVPGRELIRPWLKAGYLEADFFHVTDNGVIPQGGIISPVLLNVALHGSGSQEIFRKTRVMGNYRAQFFESQPT